MIEGRKGKTVMATGNRAFEDEPGIRCPKCGRSVDSRYVASSYPASGGHIRRRFCQCGGEILTLEKVVGANIDGFIAWGLLGQNYGGPGGQSGIGNPKAKIMGLIRSFGGKVKSL